MPQINISTNRRCQLLDITDQVANIVREQGKDARAVVVSVPHTTAGVIINECADPSVAEDILEYLNKLVPQSSSFRHSEGNSDAHIKATLVGSSIIIPVEGNKMVLGTWQGVFFAEFDGPRARKFCVTILR